MACLTIAPTALGGTYNYFTGNVLSGIDKYDRNADNSFRCVYRNWNRAFTSTGSYAVWEGVTNCTTGDRLYESQALGSTSWGPAGQFYGNLAAGCKNQSHLTLAMVCSTTVP